MEIKNKKIILRDLIKQDIEDRIYWENVETEWQLWDAPWEYDEGEGKCTIGIDIPSLSFRHKGYATYAWVLFIQYLMSKGIDDFYTQTWSGNKRLIGLAAKLGFEECNREIAVRNVREQKYDDLTFRLNKEKFLSRY